MKFNKLNLEFQQLPILGGGPQIHRKPMIFVHPASGDFQEGTDLRWEKRLVALVIKEAIFIPKSQGHGFPNMELLSEGAIIF